MTGDRTPTGDLREHFAGLADSECGEHRTVGARAWCYRDGEWCYPDAPCRGCELPALRVRAEEAERERDKARDAIADERRGRPLDIAKEVQETLEALLPHLQGEHMRDLWHANDLMSELIERLEDER